MYVKNKNKKIDIICMDIYILWTDILYPKSYLGNQRNIRISIKDNIRYNHHCGYCI